MATLRPFAPTDSVAALTRLLNRAYAPLGAAGLNFTAVDQTEAMTRERLADAHTLVAVDDGGALVGTVTLRRGYDANRCLFARAMPWFLRRDVVLLQQFAVAPECQRHGTGTALMAAAEAWTRAQGLPNLVLDTAEPATHLRERYARDGYALVGQVQWPGKTYRSVVMAKPLHGGPVPAATDTEHHAALVRAWWASVQARDWACARALLADDAQLHWPASGEWLMDADAIVRVNAIYPEGWSLTLLDATPMADGRVHSAVQVDHGDQTFFAHTLWTVAANGLLAGGRETWSTAGPPPAWRTAGAIGAYRREGAVSPAPSAAAAQSTVALR